MSQLRHVIDPEGAHAVDQQQRQCRRRRDLCCARRRKPSLSAAIDALVFRPDYPQGKLREMNSELQSPVLIACNEFAEPDFGIIREW